jgi:hypothetical protein
MNIAHAQINVFLAISHNSCFSNYYGEECPILHCSTLHCFFLEYHPKIKLTITIDGYYIVREDAASISEDVGNVFIWIFDTNLPNYIFTTTESLNEV